MTTLPPILAPLLAERGQLSLDQCVRNALDLLPHLSLMILTHASPQTPTMVSLRTSLWMTPSHRWDPTGGLDRNEGSLREPSTSTLLIGTSYNAPSLGIRFGTLPRSLARRAYAIAPPTASIRHERPSRRCSEPSAWHSSATFSTRAVRARAVKSFGGLCFGIARV